jgi:hypothetical protein
LLGRHALILFPLCAIVYAPQYAIRLVSLDPSIAMLVQPVYQMLAVSICSVAIVYTVLREPAGDRTRAGKAGENRIVRLGSMLLTAIWVGVLIRAGFALLFIPGFFVAATCACALPICIVERLNPFASVWKSAERTKGHRTGIFIVVVIVAIANVVCARLGARWEGGYTFNLIASFAFEFTLAVVFTPIYAVLSAVIYNDLRPPLEAG